MERRLHPEQYPCRIRDEEDTELQDVEFYWTGVELVG